MQVVAARARTSRIWVTGRVIRNRGVRAAQLHPLEKQVGHAWCPHNVQSKSTTSPLTVASLGPLQLQRSDEIEAESVEEGVRSSDNALRNTSIEEVGLKMIGANNMQKKCRA